MKKMTIKLKITKHLNHIDDQDFLESKADWVISKFGSQKNAEIEHFFE